MLPILDSDIDAAVELANAAVIGFAPLYQAQWLMRMRAKIGLASEEDEDRALIEGFLDAMHRARADFTLSFRALCDAADEGGSEEAIRACFADPALFDLWASGWRQRLGRDPQTPKDRAAAMRRANPYVIPRNHRIEQVIASAAGNGDFSPFERLNAALAQPYETQTDFAEYTLAPGEDEEVLRTFCGT